MNKATAIADYTKEVVEKAQSMYETDFGKVFFEEDCKYENDSPLDEDSQVEYLCRANAILTQ